MYLFGTYPYHLKIECRVSVQVIPYSTYLQYSTRLHLHPCPAYISFQQRLWCLFDTHSFSSPYPYYSTRYLPPPTRERGAIVAYLGVNLKVGM